MSHVENVLDFAKKHDKPTMIAESTPFGGIELKQASNDTKFFLANNEYDHDDFDRWFGKVISIIDKYEISMWCFINCDWESQPMWHKVGFGQTLLSSNPHVMAQWHEKIIKNGIVDRTFLVSGSLENCGATPGITGLDSESNIQSNGKGILGLSHFYFFILVPFAIVSASFFVPYFILGGHKARSGSKSRERKPLLSNMDESMRVSPSQTSDTKKLLGDGVTQC